MATAPQKESTTHWAATQYLPILLLVLVLIIAGVGFYDKSQQDDRIEDNNDRSLQNQADISNSKAPSEDTVKAWVNTANEKLIAIDSSLQTRITSLENKPASQSIAPVTTSEETQMNSRIKALEDKMTTALKDINNLEDDSTSSSSSNSNRNIQQDTTMDRPSNFYDRGDRITFSGLTDSRADVELFIAYENDRDEEVGDDTADSNGRWVITCISKCTEDRGDYEVYVLNIDNDDKSRTYDYEVD